MVRFAIPDFLNVQSCVFSLALLGCLFSTFCVKESIAEEKRPNILFIMADDHGYQAMSCYGSKVNKTPNLDRIATQGMRFDRAFVTNSICGPCRAVILTGKYSHLNGFAQNGDRFNGGQQNVAKILQANGYQTAVIGKWHLGSTPTGFDYWHVLRGQGPYYNPEMLTTDGPVKHTGYVTDIITDQALSWLKERRKADRPFFLMYHHKAPHRNWKPGPKYLNAFDDVTIPEPATLYDDYSGRGTPAKSQAMTIENHLNEHDLKLSSQRSKFTPEQQKAWDKAYAKKNAEFKKGNLSGKELIQWKYQRYAKDYLRCVQSVDDNVGRVLDYLKESGLEENTMVVYTSDQGWYLGEHGWYDKRWMYEESFRTPLVVRWPAKIAPGSVNKDMVMNLDFAQTFLDLANVDAPADMQGTSIKPILTGKTPADWRKSVYYHYYEFPGPHSVRRHYGVRTQRHKLIHFYRLNEWELFDLEKDPNELKSVYDDPEYAAVRKELEAELIRLRKKYKDDGKVVDFGAKAARNVKFQMVQQFAADKEVEVKSDQIKNWPSGKKFNPGSKPLTVGGWCKPSVKSGVLAAHGGQSLGYSLYFRDSKPVFAVRNNGALYELSGEAIDLGDWVHVAATLNADGVGQLWVNGKKFGNSKQLSLLKSQPADGFTIGADGGSLVGDYEGNSPLTGQVKDVRLYWGVPKRKQLAEWAK